MIKRVPILRNARGTGAYFISLVVGGEDILQRGGGKGDAVIHGAIRTDEEAVRDIIQESFLRFWEKRDLIEAVSISSLLFAMVRNACLNYLKHLQLVEQHNLEHLDRVVGQEELYYWDFNLSPEYTLLYKELQQQISLVMSDLPSRCREVFEMSRFKKMKNREIADALQISTTAVEKHIAKALARFSAHFKDKYPLDVYIAILAWLLSE